MVAKYLVAGAAVSLVSAPVFAQAIRPTPMAFNAANVGSGLSYGSGETASAQPLILGAVPAKARAGKKVNRGAHFMDSEGGGTSTAGLLAVAGIGVGIGVAIGDIAFSSDNNTPLSPVK